MSSRFSTNRAIAADKIDEQAVQQQMETAANRAARTPELDGRPPTGRGPRPGPVARRAAGGHVGCGQAPRRPTRIHWPKAAQSAALQEAMACQTGSVTSLAMKLTEPSAMTRFTPPGWRLRAVRQP